MSTHRSPKSSQKRTNTCPSCRAIVPQLELQLVHSSKSGCEVSEPAHLGCCCLYFWDSFAAPRHTITVHVRMERTRTAPICQSVNHYLPPPKKVIKYVQPVSLFKKVIRYKPDIVPESDPGHIVQNGGQVRPLWTLLDTTRSGIVLDESRKCSRGKSRGSQDGERWKISERRMRIRIKRMIN